MKKIKTKGKDKEKLVEKLSYYKNEPLCIQIDQSDFQFVDEIVLKNISTIELHLSKEEISEKILQIISLNSITSIELIIPEAFKSVDSLQKILETKKTKLKELTIRYRPTFQRQKSTMNTKSIPIFQYLRELTLDTLLIDDSLNKSLSNTSLKKLAFIKCQFDSNYHITFNMKSIESLYIFQCEKCPTLLKTIYSSIRKSKNLYQLEIKDTKYDHKYLYLILRDTSCQKLRLEFESFVTKLFDQTKLNEYKFHLKSLIIISSNKQPHETLSFIKANPQLEELNLSVNINEDLFNILKEFTKLKSFSFQYADFDYVAKLLRIIPIEELKIDSLNTILNKNFQKVLENNQNLKSLEMSMNLQSGMYYFNPIISFKYLERLTIHFCTSLDTDLKKFLKGLTKSKTLKYLNIELYDHRFRFFKNFLLENTSLEVLILSNTKNDDIKDIFKGLKVNKFVKRCIIEFYPRIVEYDSEIHDLFQQNFTLTDLKISKKSFDDSNYHIEKIGKDLIKKYCRRNQKMRKIYQSFTIETDINFQFD